MAKRKTEDFEVGRMSERLRSAHGSRIKSGTDFDTYYTKTMMLSKDEMSSGQKRFMNEVKNHYAESYMGGSFQKVGHQERVAELEGVVREQRRFKRDREIKEVLREQKRFGITPRREVEYESVGRKKGRVVYAHRDTVKIKGKTIIKYRDKKGQFVSVRK